MSDTARLLSGGNPQIGKGEGAAVVQSYIAAMPGWKRAVGERIDALVTARLATVAKAVKWNTPLYGVEMGSWFLAYHCYTRYVKVTFFRGLSLSPVPPIASKSGDTRYLHIGEPGSFDEPLFISWVDQAIGLPGERL